MKRKTIIHIYSRTYDAYFPEEGSDYYYLAGWSSAVARQTSRYTNRYHIENWRTDRSVTRPIVRVVQGVTCRLFPSCNISVLKDVSISMLRELRNQIGKNEILIHHHTIHRNSLYAIASIFGNLPIIAQHHGDSPTLVRYKQNKRLRTLVSYFIEKEILRYVDFYFVLRKSERDFLSQFVPRSQIAIQTMGVDFSIFKPINKATVRHKLKLTQNKKIILYVGHFYKLKGVDIILNAYKELKRKYNVELLLVGGSSNDELYEEVIASGARFYGILPHSMMPLYFNAADIYLLPTFESNYRGIDVTTIESLACGTPIVSTTLKDFPTNEWQRLGRIPKSRNDVVECVSEIFDHPNRYRSCRKVAKRYYDWRCIIANTLDVYDALFNKYYDHK